MALVDAPYPEMLWNRAANHVVHGALALRFEETVRGAHFRCGSALVTQNWGGASSCRWVGVEPDSELCNAAKAQPFRSANNLGAFFASGGDHRLINAPMRRDYTFRCEPLTRTSIATGIAHRLVLELGHRGDDDFDGVVEEMCRVGRPGAIVVLVRHGPVEVDCWAVNDVVAPNLSHLRRSMRRGVNAFEKLKLREIGVGQYLFTEACFNLKELTRHYEDDPAHLRRQALDGWTARGFFDRIVRKHWGQWKVRRNVRRRLRIFVGKVPSDATELRRARRA